MTDIEWMTAELEKYRQEEVEALVRLRRTHEIMIEAKADYAFAKEALAGIRGGIDEFTFQLDYANQNGRLP